ncbi:MAG: protein-glutamate O-methyltransferase CheR [Coxiellaceae bacterium]|nr:protein-glutamate O-methyltransferase CheR [Coxiellaceae bacterium]
MQDRQDLTIDVITNIINRLYGYDFSGYVRSSLKRRLLYVIQRLELNSLADLIPLLINDDKFFKQLLSDLSITVTEFFRDAHFYISFRKNVIPKLETYPYIKVWSAGCSTGEEVYSIAIMLHEHQLLKRSKLYATDFNPFALEVARKGIYDDGRITKSLDSYKEFNCDHSLVDYFTECYDMLKIKKSLHDAVIFSHHNLATDVAFCDMEVIFCRNVMIYFDDDLRERCIQMFYDSLVPFGYLCLGDKESLDSPRFKVIDKAAAIYQKVPVNEN